MAAVTFAIQMALTSGGATIPEWWESLYPYLIGIGAGMTATAKFTKSTKARLLIIKTNGTIQSPKRTKHIRCSINFLWQCRGHFWFADKHNPFSTMTATSRQPGHWLNCNRQWLILLMKRSSMACSIISRYWMLSERQNISQTSATISRYTSVHTICVRPCQRRVRGFAVKKIDRKHLHKILCPAQGVHRKGAVYARYNTQGQDRGRDYAGYCRSFR